MIYRRISQALRDAWAQMFHEEANVTRETAEGMADDVEKALALEIIEILASPGQHQAVSFFFLHKRVPREHAERVAKATNDSMVTPEDASIRILVHGLRTLGAQSICELQGPSGLDGIAFCPEIRQQIGIAAGTERSLAEASNEYGKALRSIVT